MDVDAYVAALRREGELLAEAAGRADPDAPIATCPDWRMRDLIWHVGGVHRWAATVVREHRTEPLGLASAQDIVETLPDDQALVEWFREGHEQLVETLDEADPDIHCWSFLPAPSPLAFWARRQAHETGIHRIDAQTTAATRTPFPPDMAADGIDELLTGFVARRSRKLRSAAARTLQVQASDIDAGWRVEVGPDRVDVTRDDGSAEAAGGHCVLRGPASDLYQLLWNRRDAAGLDIQGNGAFLDVWRDSVRIRWA